jgi:hypothetical protein
MLCLLLACVLPDAEKSDDDEGADSATDTAADAAETGDPPDSGDPAETGDPADSGDPGESGQAVDSAETGDPADSGADDTGEPVEPGAPLLLRTSDANAWLENGGSEVALLPDLDGDGLAEVLLGDPDGSDERGVAWIARGTVGGEMVRDDWNLRGICGGGDVFEGVYWDCERLGHQVASLGDTDGDGVDDLLVSAPGWSRDGERGAVLVVSGPLDEVSDADRIEGETWAAGEGAVALGDTDGDGLGDLALLDWGTLLVHRGPLDGVLLAETLDDRVTGLHPIEYEAEYQDGDLAAVGDLDGDGVGDLAVADTYDVAVWILSGDVRGEMAVADVGVPIAGESGDGYVGRVAGAGDTDGDGNADLVASFYSEGTALFRGPFPEARAFADADATYDLALDFAGENDLASGGDADADGRDDVLLVGEGEVWRVPGHLSGARTVADDFAVHLEPAGDEAGLRAAIVGDLDGDDVPELIAAGEWLWVFDGAGL